MSGDPFGPIGRYYDDLVARYGHSPRACDYGRPESQRQKFEVIAAVMPLAGKRVLDVGCGFADFAGFLAQHVGDVSYEGVDISEAMVTTASRLWPKHRIRRLNILTENPGTYDVVTANGIFYLLGEQAASLAEALIRRMLDLAREAVAFNSLSAWAKDPEPDEYYADPLRMLDFCRALCPRVVLRHDYHPRDFTIYMYKQEQR